MAGDARTQVNFARLRRQAEELLAQQEPDKSRGSRSMLELIHDLEIHEAELGIQNQELQAAQQEICALQQEYADLYEFAPCGYVTLSPRLIVTRANLGAVKLLGAERASLQRMGLSRFLRSSSDAGFYAALMEAGRTGEKQTIDLELHGEAGTPAWICAEIHADRNECGQVDQWRLVLIDITERKRMEHLILNERDAASEIARTSSAQEAMQVCTRLVMAVPGIDACQIYMIDEGSGDFILQRSQGLSAPRAAGARRIAAQSEQGRRFSAGIPVHADDAGRSPAGQADPKYSLRTISIIPLTERGQVIGCLTAASRSLTTLSPHARHALESFSFIVSRCLGRLRDESAMSQSAELFRGVFENSPIGIAVVDMATQRFIKANRGFLDIVGYHEEELEQLTPRDLVHPDDREEQEDRLGTLSAADEPQPSGIEKRYVRKDGLTRRVLVSGSSLYPANSAPLSVANVHDITEQREIEECLLQLQKMDAIGQLAGGIAHDFNNQLCGILGYAELLESKLAEPKLKRFAECIRKAACRATDLTENLLGVARKGKRLASPVDLHEIVGDAVAILERSVDRRISMRMRLEATRSVVTGDPNQLQNALLNLGLNARDAMPQGGELIFATADAAIAEAPPAEELPAGQYLVLSVIDSGVGMDAQTQARIFEPFFTTKPPGKGTGLGLSSVYGIVKNHGGAIRVCSQSGRGSIFRIHLPLSADRPNPAPAEPDVLRRGHGRVLLVDDEADIRDAAGEILRDHGYEILVCENPIDALALYEKEWRGIDVVIIDMIMPNMGGNELFLAMRHINPAIRALLSSGYSINGESQRTLDAGALDFVQKPFCREMLLRKLDLARTNSAGKIAGSH